MTAVRSEVEALRAEVAELRKLVIDLMARGVTITHVHTSPALPDRYVPNPYLPQYPSRYPWNPYNPTWTLMGQALPVQCYNGDCQST